MKYLFFILTSLLLFLSCKKEDKKQSQPTTPTQPTTPAYTIKYFGNHNDAGTVPVDGISYHSGDTATILGNTGNLSYSGNTFIGWNTDSSGTGTDYCVGTRVPISNANLKLYAKWISSSINPSSGNTSLNCGGSGWLKPTCTSSGSLTLKSTNGPIEVSLTFGTIPSTGIYSVSTVAGPSNVLVTVQNAPGQPCSITWYGKTGTVSVTTTSNSINAAFTGIQCTQATYVFPVVSLSGSVGCN